jgi:ferredoxin-NADP reductase
MMKYDILLKEVRDVADGTRLFLFARPDEYVFKAGQYAALILQKPEGFEVDNRGLVRPLSIASAPYENTICFAMRQGESSFKQLMWSLRPGDSAMLMSPVGAFTVPDNDDRPIVFMVGGIGITPAWSILRQAEHERSARSFTLFYANRFQKDAAYDEELRKLTLSDFRYVQVLSRSDEPCQPENDERGYVDESMIRKYVANPADCLYYLVGSPQVVESFESILDSIGVSKEQRIKDPFSGMASQSAQQK